MPKYLLGIDNGGTIAKAAVIALDGREVAVASRKTEMLSPRPGHTERDMDRLWQATAEAMRQVLAESRVPPQDIACVATTGHGNGLYLVDKQGRPVRNGIISTDTRAKDYVARWNADGMAKAVLPLTMQCLWPGQPNALLAWLRDNEPDVMRRAGWVLMCKDYVRFRLTGQIAAERTDMSGTNLMSVPPATTTARARSIRALRDARPAAAHPAVGGNLRRSDRRSRGRHGAAGRHARGRRPVRHRRLRPGDGHGRRKPVVHDRRHVELQSVHLADAGRRAKTCS